MRLDLPNRNGPTEGATHAPTSGELREPRQGGVRARRPAFISSDACICFGGEVVESGMEGADQRAWPSFRGEHAAKQVIKAAVKRGVKAVSDARSNPDEDRCCTASPHLVQARGRRCHQLAFPPACQSVRQQTRYGGRRPRWHHGPPLLPPARRAGGRSWAPSPRRLGILNRPRRPIPAPRRKDEAKSKGPDAMQAAGGLPQQPAPLVLGAAPPPRQPAPPPAGQAGRPAQH